MNGRFSSRTLLRGLVMLKGNFLLCLIYGYLQDVQQCHTSVIPFIGVADLMLLLGGFSSNVFQLQCCCLCYIYVLIPVRLDFRWNEILYSSIPVYQYRSIENYLYFLLST